MMRTGTAQKSLLLLFIMTVGLGIYLWRAEPREEWVLKRAALWVPRFDYQTPADIRQIMQHAANTGFTDIFFQVRGNGTVFYNSNREPWAHDLHGGHLEKLGVDPGWDPLQVAIEEARKQALQLHAYINVLPGWKGRQLPPSGRGQPWADHRDWFMVDALGDVMQPTAGWYTFLNPAHPAVIEHLVGIVEELLSYDVDGIHLDYIRYPYDYYLVADELYGDLDANALKQRSDFSFDRFTTALQSANQNTSNEERRRKELKCEIISRLVARLAQQMEQDKPRAILSASVLGNPVDGRMHAGQKPARWLASHGLDWAVQMNYSDALFSTHAVAFRKELSRQDRDEGWMMGISAEHDNRLFRRQLQRLPELDCHSVAIFSYGLLYEGHQATHKSRILHNFLSHHLEQEAYRH